MKKIIILLILSILNFSNDLYNVPIPVPEFYSTYTKPFNNKYSNYTIVEKDGKLSLLMPAEISIKEYTKDGYRIKMTTTYQMKEPLDQKWESRYKDNTSKLSSMSFSFTIQSDDSSKKNEDKVTKKVVKADESLLKEYEDMKIRHKMEIERLKQELEKLKLKNNKKIKAYFVEFEEGENGACFVDLDSGRKEGIIEDDKCKVLM